MEEIRLVHLVTTGVFFANMLTIIFIYGAFRWSRRERSDTENDDGAGWDLAMIGVPLLLFASSAFAYFG